MFSDNKNAVVSPDGVSMVNAQIDVDTRKQKLYTSVEDANTSIPQNYRKEGLEILLKLNGTITPYMWQGGVADEDLKPSPGSDNFTYQEITEGGNYNDLEVTADVLIFSNEEAQAIVNGVWGKSQFFVVNFSTTYEVQINNNSESVSGNGLPINTAAINGAGVGVKGTARFLKMPADYGYHIADVYVTLDRPEFGALTKKMVTGVDENNKAFTYETFEMEVNRDAQNTQMTKDELNAAYPQALRPFIVNCPLLEGYYKLMDDNNKDWWFFRGTKIENPV